MRPYIQHILLSFSSLLNSSILAYAHGHHFTQVHPHVGRAEKRLLLNSLKEPVDVSGEHAWQAPQDGDQRGPCPGLNALANHGYIPRDGIVSLLEVIPTINSVYGMGIDLAVILGIMGTVWTGNILSLSPSFSIGGEDARVQNLFNLLGLIGTPEGLNRSHNFIEVDSSPMQNDLYSTGDPVTMNLTIFESFYDMVPENSGETLTMDMVGDFAAKRLQDSINTNPDFYYGPVTGTIARNAGFFFFGRIFRNHSLEQPSGELTHDILKSFFGVTGDRHNFTYNFGHERIPENWYKSPIDYGLVQMNLDLVDLILKHPEIADVGGNMGEVNTFTGLDINDPIVGLLNAQNLLKDNNLLCFVMQIVKFAAPNYTNNLFSTLVDLLNPILDEIGLSLLNLSCPATADLEAGGRSFLEEIEAKYPGATFGSS